MLRYYREEHEILSLTRIDQTVAVTVFKIVALSGMDFKPAVIVELGTVA